MRPRFGRLTVSGFALLVTVVAFAPALTSPPFLDDFLHLERAQHLSPPALLSASTLRAADLPALWWVPPDAEARYFRPLIALSFALDRRVWGAATFGYHLMNLLAHILVVLLVYRIGKQLLQNRSAARAAALLFLWHPIHAGAVQWISGRSDVYMTGFYLLAVASYLDLRLNSSERTGKAVLVPLVFGAALLSKESAISLPALIVCLECLLLRGAPTAGRIGSKTRWTWLALAAIGGLYVFLRLPSLIASPPPLPYRLPLHVAMLPDLLLQLLLYALSCLFLLPMLPFHNLEAWRQHPVLLGALGALFLVLCVIAGRRASRPRLHRFLIAWFVVTLLPVDFIMMGQRLAYLASAGFCLLLAAVLIDREPRAASPDTGPANRPAGGTIRRWALPILLGLYALLTMVQASVLRALSEGGLRQTQAILEVAHREPQPRRIFLVNGWIPCCFWISQATRWLSPAAGPPITVLSLSPELFPVAFRDRHPVSTRLIDWLARPIASGGAPQLAPAGPAAVILRSSEAEPPGLFGSPILGFFLLGRRSFAAGETVRTEVLTAEIGAVTGAGVREIRFSLPQPLSDPGNVWVMQDSLRIREITHLTRWNGPGRP